MIWTETVRVKIVLKEGMETRGRAHVMTAKSQSNDDCKVTPYSKEIYVLSAAISWINIHLSVHFLIVMPVQKKPAMKKPAAVMKTPAMKKPAGKPTPKATTDSGSNSPLPPMPDELQQLQAGLDRSAQNPEILEEAFQALGEPEPEGTPENDPELDHLEQVMEGILDEAIHPPTTPAAKAAPKPIAGPDSDSPWTTQSSDSDSSQTLELPGRDDLPKGADVC